MQTTENKIKKLKSIFFFETDNFLMQKFEMTKPLQSAIKTFRKVIREVLRELIEKPKKKKTVAELVDIVTIRFANEILS